MYYFIKFKVINKQNLIDSSSILHYKVLCNIFQYLNELCLKYAVLANSISGCIVWNQYGVKVFR